MKARNIFYTATDCVLVFLFVYLIVSPENASLPTKNALDFCAKTLIPSLFIYMVLSKAVISMPITARLCKAIGLGPVMLIMGTLCGAPIGAKNALSLYESGRIDKKHAEYLCSFTNNASVSFVIGFVGSELYGDILIGLRLFVYQLIASVIAAFAIKILMYGKAMPPKADIIKSRRIGLREAVSDSALTMLNICACAVFFIVAGDAISNILQLGTTANACLKSVLEFSSGCAEASKLEAFSLPICAFSIGATGLSVTLQVRSVISGKLSIKPFLSGKLISGAVMTALSVIIG